LLLLIVCASDVPRFIAVSSSFLKSLSIQKWGRTLNTRRKSIMRRFCASVAAAPSSEGVLAAAAAAAGGPTPALHPVEVCSVAVPMTTSCSRVALVESRRTLKIAKSVFGYYLGRQGQRKFPFHRRPHFKGTFVMNLNAPHYWSFATTKCQAHFLPEENYITGDWTGKFFVSSRQVYTLQHATAGVKCRMKRFPSVFEFNNPSRWNIGKELQTLSKPRMDLIDEQMLTKKQRLDYVKAGMLPK
jgi:hypothetical protein